MPQPLPSLNAVRAFEVVARLGSVSAAASELFVTPGAVSRHIKGLEEDLGVMLLERDGRGVRLTAAGKHLHGGLESAFAQISRTIVQTRQQLLRSTIRIFSLPLFAATWLVPRIDRFRDLAPETDVIVHEKFPATDATALDADLIIEWGYFASNTDMVAEKLGDEEIFPVCSPRVRTNGSLAGAPLLHYEDAPYPWHWPDWPTFLAAVGLDGIDATKGPRLSRGLMLDALREGKGVALLCNSVSHEDLVAGRLVRPVPEYMTTGNGYWLLTPRHKLDRPEIMAFRSWLLKEIATRRGGDMEPPPPPPPPRHTGTIRRPPADCAPMVIGVRSVNGEGSPDDSGSRSSGPA